MTSCDQGKIKNSNQCLGEWKLLDDNSHKKSFILKENGKVEFNNLSIKAGTWKLVLDESKGSFLEIWFSRDGGEYGQGGKLVKEKELEVWFTVGDPDDFKWKRFRLVNPYYANRIK